MVIILGWSVQQVFAVTIIQPKITKSSPQFDQNLVRLDWKLETTSSKVRVIEAGVELSINIKDTKYPSKSTSGFNPVSKFQPPSEWKKSGDPFDVAPDLKRPILNEYISTQGFVYNNKPYQYDGSVAELPINTTANFKVFAPHRSEKDSVDFTLIDRITPKILPSNDLKDLVITYRIVPIIRVATQDDKVGFSTRVTYYRVYKGPSFDMEVDFSKSATPPRPEYDAQWYKTNYFPNRGTFPVTIMCNGGPPKIFMNGSGDKLGRTPGNRPDITFTLTMITQARGLEFRDQNKFYFVGNKPVDPSHIAISIADGQEEPYLAWYQDLEDGGDDTAIDTVTIKVDQASFYKCLINRYYNKFDPAIGTCEPASAGKENYQVGDKSYQSRCISITTVDQDGIKHKFNTSEGGITPNNPNADTSTNCTASLKGFWQRLLIGKAICGTLELLGAIAFFFANLAFSMLIYASGLQ